MDSAQPSARSSFDAREVTIDEVALRGRAADLGKRSIKNDAKRQGIAMAMSMVDLTTLEGADTPGRVRRLCRRAISPGAGLPPVAAVCVYPRLVPVARREVDGTPVRVCAVASGFPAGQVPLGIKLEDTKAAVEDGAEEIDIVIARGSLLAGDLERVHDEIAALAEAAGPACLKVILETGELGSFDQIANAAWVACRAGADFVKTSTGKVSINSTPATALCLLHVVRDYAAKTGRIVGVKCAGGIRSSKEALHYLVLVNETLGPSWLVQSRFRIGASSLVDDLVRQMCKMQTGRYVGFDDVVRD
ncbi:MAG: deoxyribose-phosphate aldolase [Planctomycetes bacterium]|nr:deoxyribose-phosphate aldolase [Planctomycetota bacterium]MCB9918481.1 deoxyribose-phosphate aldolase [Planctomycetota bacterium]